NALRRASRFDKRSSAAGTEAPRPLPQSRAVLGSAAGETLWGRGKGRGGREGERGKGRPKKFSPLSPSLSPTAQRSALPCVLDRGAEGVARAQPSPIPTSRKAGRPPEGVPSKRCRERPPWQSVGFVGGKDFRGRRGIACL